MNRSFPKAKSSQSPDDRDRLRRVVQQRGLCGLANDTKWDEFITAIRARDGWRPKYRCKCIDGLPSYWDSEWFYHLPFPLISVEWLDVEIMEQTHRGNLMPLVRTDHSAWIEELLRRVGLEFQKGNTMIRIFGYSPRNYDLFDEIKDV